MNMMIVDMTGEQGQRVRKTIILLTPEQVLELQAEGNLATNPDHLDAVMLSVVPEAAMESFMEGLVAAVMAEANVDADQVWRLDYREDAG